VVVRRVTATGQPAPGYTVTDETDDSFVCGGDSSPVAVSPNVRFCGYSATDTVACWKSTGMSVLRLRSPLRHRLVRIPYIGSFAPIAAPTHPGPEAVVLDDGLTCLVRDGGAWSAIPSRPGWVGWYYCLTPNGALSPWTIYGPRGGNGIDETSPSWTVQTVAVSGQGPVVTRAVRTAYFGGTA
jgi:hypothetical protein